MNKAGLTKRAVDGPNYARILKVSFLLSHYPLCRTATSEVWSMPLQHSISSFYLCSVLRRGNSKSNGKNHTGNLVTKQSKSDGVSARSQTRIWPHLMHASDHDRLLWREAHSPPWLLVCTTSRVVPTTSRSNHGNISSRRDIFAKTPLVRKVCSFDQIWTSKRQRISQEKWGSQPPSSEAYQETGYNSSHGTYSTLWCAFVGETRRIAVHQPLFGSEIVSFEPSQKGGPMPTITYFLMKHVPEPIAAKAWCRCPNFPTHVAHLADAHLMFVVSIPSQKEFPPWECPWPSFEIQRIPGWDMRNKYESK